MNVWDWDPGLLGAENHDYLGRLEFDEIFKEHRALEFVLRQICFCLNVNKTGFVAVCLLHVYVV